MRKYEIRQEINQLKSELSIVKRKISQCETASSNLHELIVKLKMCKNDLLEADNVLRKNIINNMSADNNKCQEAYELSNKTIIELENSVLATLNSDISSLNRKISSINNQIERLEVQYANAEN